MQNNPDYLITATELLSIRRKIPSNFQDVVVSEQLELSVGSNQFISPVLLVDADYFLHWENTNCTDTKSASRSTGTVVSL